ncbi:MAG: hypothetical protein WAZ18_07200 [Alphaproteobacteria bacterium]
MKLNFNLEEAEGLSFITDEKLGIFVVLMTDKFSQDWRVAVTRCITNALNTSGLRGFSFDLNGVSDPKVGSFEIDIQEGLSHV